MLHSLANGATLVESSLFKSSLGQAYENGRVRLLNDKGFNQAMCYAVGAPETSLLTGSLQVYVHRLRTFVLELSQGSPYKVPLLTMMDRLEHHNPPPLFRAEPMDKIVCSTNVGEMAKIPKTFLEWSTSLATSPPAVVSATSGSDIVGKVSINQWSSRIS